MTGYICFVVRKVNLELMLCCEVVMVFGYLRWTLEALNVSSKCFDIQLGKVMMV